MIRIVYYTDLTSSWCYWAEPAWAELKSLYHGRAEFEWKIALLDAAALPVSQEQIEWFYRRSGTTVRSPFMLNSGWYEKGVQEYIVPNLLAEAAKDFGVTDDRVRLPLTHAALRDGLKVNRWEVALPIAARAGSLNESELKVRAQSPEIEKRVRASTTEFHALQVTQRPTFVLENPIGDKAVFSGLWVAAPIAATIDAMLTDAASYTSWATHMGKPPTA